MRAIVVERGNFYFKDLPDPIPKSDEIIVRVNAFGINRADLLQRAGKYPPPPGASDLLGMEVSGIVETCGTYAKRFQEGDRVCCLLPGGGYAERVAVHEGLAFPLPPNLSFEEGAAIPEAFLTAYQALFQIGELRPEQWVLIHAAGSGVGTAALQLVRAMDGKAIGTTRTHEKMEKCLDLGADAMIHPYRKKFADTVLEVTEGHGVDLILDFIGAPYYEENVRSLAIGGALIFISTLGGGVQEEVDFRILMKKWATLSGTTLRNRPLQYKQKLIQEFSTFALPRFERRELQPVLHTNLPWEEVEEAHRLLEKNRIFGKITLSIV